MRAVEGEDGGIAGELAVARQRVGQAADGRVPAEQRSRNVFQSMRGGVDPGHVDELVCQRQPERPLVVEERRGEHDDGVEESRGHRHDLVRRDDDTDLAAEPEPPAGRIHERQHMLWSCVADAERPGPEPRDAEQRETPDREEQIRLFREIARLNEENLWDIGVIGGLPSIYLVSDSFRNVPHVAVSGWSFRAPGNTAIECYAIEGATDGG